MSQLDDRSTRVPVADPTISDRAKERVLAVLERGDLADGEPVREFEREFADFCDVDHGVAASNGTAALHAALHACGIGEGDTVITSPFSFVATANAVRFCGAEPVFADVDPDTLNLDPASVREAIEARDGDVDALLPVHLYGLPADMGAFAALADEYDAVLVEDAAQAHGGTYRGDPVGSFGDAAAFSFYPTKNMTTGEGGMVVTDRDDVAERAARFVNHGRNGDGEHVSLGHNFRMTSVSGAIGLVQLDRLPAFVRTRREHANRYNAALDGVPVTPPPEPAGTRHAYHQYTVRCADRDHLAAHLDDYGVDSAVYYPTPIDEEPAYDDVSGSTDDVSASTDDVSPSTDDVSASTDDVSPSTAVAARAADEVLSIPVHPELSLSQVETVATALESYDPPAAVRSTTDEFEQYGRSR